MFKLLQKMLYISPWNPKVTYYIQPLSHRQRTVIFLDNFDDLKLNARFMSTSGRGLYKTSLNTHNELHKTLVTDGTPWNSLAPTEFLEDRFLIDSLQLEAHREMNRRLFTRARAGHGYLGHSNQGDCLESRMMSYRWMPEGFVEAFDELIYETAGPRHVHNLVAARDVDLEELEYYNGK